MAKIVLGEKAKLDHRTTLEAIKEIDSLEDLSNDEAVVHVVESTPENVATLSQATHTLYIPATSVSLNESAIADVHVYFDLENYPFYQSAKEIIEQRANNVKPKGVFRYRRTVKKTDEDETLAADLFVISSLLGDPVDVHVTRTDQQNNPAHTIILLNFGNGTLAHVEYTIADENRIELEWSGISSIIEFDSNELNPFDPITKTKLPLMYSVDSILQLSRKLDEALVEKLANFKNIINGGGQK